MDVPDRDIARLAQMIRVSSNTVIFSGAGISTQSGIPDFRSPGGIWTQFAPVEFHDYISDPQARRISWERRFAMDRFWNAAKPNQGHMAVADLIARRFAGCVITQNIDALHQASGVPKDKIIELHGNTHYAKCLSCGTHVEIAPFAPILSVTGRRRTAGCAAVSSRPPRSPLGSPCRKKRCCGQRTPALPAN